MRIVIPSTLARLALSALAAAALAAPLRGQQVERFTLAGRSAAVHNLAGEVTVAPGTGSAIVVEITRGGADARQLRVNRDGGEVRVIYPGDRVVYSRLEARARSSFNVRRNGRLGSALMGSRRVTVAGSGAGTRAHADVRVLVPAGRTIAIHQGVGRVQVTNVNGTVEVRAVSAPVSTRGTRGELSVDVGSGAVDVRDAQGDVTVDVGSGAVTLANVRGTTLDVGSGNGGVSGSGLRVRTLDVGSGSGRVGLSGVTAADVTVDTGRGAVELGMLSDVERMDISTGSGAVTVTVPAAFGAQLELETSSGGIRVDLPMRDQRHASDSLTGRVGDGDGRVEIGTGSGAIRIRRG